MPKCGHWDPDQSKNKIFRLSLNKIERPNHKHSKMISTTIRDNFLPRNSKFGNFSNFCVVIGFKSKDLILSILDGLNHYQGSIFGQDIQKI